MALARDVLAAVGREGGVGPGVITGAADEVPDPATVADAVWRRAHAGLPDGRRRPVAPARLAGATWLIALVDALPANGHVLLASRSSPAVPSLAWPPRVRSWAWPRTTCVHRRRAGRVRRRPGLAIGRLDDAGGWPAMAELAASVGDDMAGDHLWEDVLEPLGLERRHVLAVVTDLGGADDGLAAAALGEPVDLGGALGGVPPVARGADGWLVPYALARRTPGAGAGRRRAGVRAPPGSRPSDRQEPLRRRPGPREAGLVDVVPQVLRAACLGAHRPPGRQLDRWLADLPDDVDSRSAGSPPRSGRLCWRRPRRPNHYGPPSTGAARWTTPTVR